MFSRTINPSPFTVNNSRIPSPPSRVVPNDHRGDIQRALTNNNNSNDSNQFFASVCSSSLYSSLGQSFPANDDDFINSNSTTGLASTSGNDDVSVPPAVTANAAVLNSEDEPTQFPSFVAEIQSNLPEFDEGKKLIAQAHQKFGPNCGMTGRVCNADSCAANADDVLFAIVLSFCVEDMERMLQMKNRHEFVNPSINTVYRLHVRRFMQCGLTEEEAEDFVLNHSVWIDSCTAEAAHDWRWHRDKKSSYVYLMETLGLRKLNSIMHKSLLECFPNLKIIVGFGEEAMEMLDLLREYFPRQINQQRIVHHPSQVYNGMLTNAQLHRLLRLTVFRVVDAILDREPTVREDQVDLSDYARTTKNSTAIEIRSLDGKLLGIFEWKADVAKLLGVSATTLYLNTDDEGVFTYYGKAFLQIKKIGWTGIEFGKTEDGADELRRIIQEIASRREAFYSEMTSNPVASIPVEVCTMGGKTLAILEAQSKAADLLGVSSTTVYSNTNADGVFSYYGNDMCRIKRTDRKDFGKMEDGADELRRIIQEIATLRDGRASTYNGHVEVCNLEGMTLAILESPSKAADLLGVSSTTVYSNTDDEGVFRFRNKEVCRIQQTDRKDFGKMEDGADELRHIIQEIATLRDGRASTYIMREQRESKCLRVYTIKGKCIGTASSIDEVSEWTKVDQWIIAHFLQTTNDGFLSIYGKKICRLEKVMIGFVADLEEIREATSAITTESFDSSTSTTPSPNELTNVTEAVSTVACDVAAISSEGEGSDMIQKQEATMLLTVPPGRLGLTVKNDKVNGGILITEIDPVCTLKQLEVGDRIVTIDGIKTTSIAYLNINKGNIRKFGIAKKKDTSANASTPKTTHPTPIPKVPAPLPSGESGVCNETRATAGNSTDISSSTSATATSAAPAAKKRKKDSSSIDDGPHKAKKKYYRKTCTADGCANIAMKGGVCRQHGANVKLCTFLGCTNQARSGGVCKRHGAKK